MARRQVVEVSCDRCERVETQPVEPEDGKRPEFELVVSFHCQEIKYEDLCRRCRSAVENYFNNMTKQPEEEVSKEAGTPRAPEKNFLGMQKKVG